MRRHVPGLIALTIPAPEPAPSILRLIRTDAASEMSAVESNCVAVWLCSPAATLTFTSYTSLPLPFNYGHKLVATACIFMKPKAKVSSDVQER